MQRRFYHSIRFRIVASIIAVLSAVMSIFFYLLHNYYRNQMVDNLRNYTIHLSDTVESSLELAMLAYKIDEIQEMIERMEDQEEIKKIFIINKSGEVRISSRRDEIGQTIASDSPTCQICHKREPENRSKTVIFTLPNGQKVFRNANPIANQPQCYVCHDPKQKINGMLILDYSMLGITKQLSSNVREMMIAVVVTAIILIVVIGLLMNKIVIKKLTHLVEATKQIGKGDLKRRIDFSGDDEIGVLASSFNEMTQNLEDSMKKIKAGKNYLENLINSIEDGITVVDRGYRIVTANDAVLMKKHLAREKVIGAHCYEVSYDFQKPCNDPLHPCPVRETFKTGKLSRVLHTHPDGSGESRYLEIHSSPVRDEKGEIIHVIEVMRDITERRHLEAQLIHSEQLASLGRLAAGVAHEINNPMASITACVEGLQRRSKSIDISKLKGLDDLPEYLEVIRKVAYRCKGIAEKLLSFSHKTRPVLETIDLNEIIFDAVSLVEYEASLDNKKIIKDLDAHIPAVKADRSQLNQLFLNLILNGLDAIEGPGEVRIATRRVDKNVQITFEDTGYGIAEENIDRIFEPFYTTKSVGQGTGLGLSICESIVRKHGGIISVRSKLGVGTVFSVTLPIDQNGAETID